jgi:hypothetical protein
VLFSIGASSIDPKSWRSENDSTTHLFLAMLADKDDLILRLETLSSHMSGEAETHLMLCCESGDVQGFF